MGILDLFGIGDNSNSGNATGNYLGNLIDPNTAQQFAQAQKDQALLGLSAGLLAGSGPSRLPVPFGAALGQGLLGMMQAQNALPQQALQSAQTSNAVTESQLKKAQTAAAIQQQQFARIYGSKLIDVLNGGGQTANPSGASSTGNNAGPVNLAAQTLAPSTADALNLIAGPESGGNYFIGTGQKPGSQDLLNAPLDSSGFPTWEGHGNSHAAGRYQIQPGTWQDTVDKHFGGYLDWRKPENQDMVAAKLYEDKGFSPWAQYNPKLAAMIQNREALGVNGAPPSIGGMTAPVAQNGGGAAPTGQTGIAGLPPINGGYPMGLPMSPAQAQALTALAPLGGMKPADFMNGIAGLPVDLLKQAQDAFVKKQAEAQFAGQIAGNTKAGGAPYDLVDVTVNGVDQKMPLAEYLRLRGQAAPSQLPSVPGSNAASGLLAPPRSDATGGLLAPGGPVVGAPAPAPMPASPASGLLAPGGPVVGARPPMPGSTMVPGGAVPFRAVTGTGPVPAPQAALPGNAASGPAPGFDPNVWAAQHAKSFPQGIGLVGGHLMPIDEQGNPIPNAPGWRGFTGAPQAAQAGPMAPPGTQVPPAAPIAQSAPNAPQAQAPANNNPVFGKPVINPLYQAGIQGVIAGDTKRIQETYTPAADQANDLVGTATLIKDLLPMVATGAGADIRQQGARILSAMGANEKGIQDLTGTNPTAADVIQKKFLEQSSSAVRAMGAREPGSVISLFSKAYPNLTSQKNAIELMENVFLMQAQRSQDRLAQATDWHNQQLGNLQNNQPYQSLSNFDVKFNSGVNNSANYLKAAEAMSGMSNAWKGLSKVQEQAVWSIIPKGVTVTLPDGSTRTK